MTLGEQPLSPLGPGRGPAAPSRAACHQPRTRTRQTQRFSGSTCPNRNRKQAARWLLEIASRRADAQLELVDHRTVRSPTRYAAAAVGEAPARVRSGGIHVRGARARRHSVLLGNQGNRRNARAHRRRRPSSSEVRDFERCGVGTGAASSCVSSGMLPSPSAPSCTNDAIAVEALATSHPRAPGRKTSSPRRAAERSWVNVQANGRRCYGRCTCSFVAWLGRCRGGCVARFIE